MPTEERSVAESRACIRLQVVNARISRTTGTTVNQMKNAIAVLGPATAWAPAIGDFNGAADAAEDS